MSGWSWGWSRGGVVSAPSHTWQAVWAIRLKVARDRASSARATAYTPAPPAPVTACSPLDARDASASGQSDTQRDAPLPSSSTSPPAASASTSPPAAAVPPQATAQATPQATPPATPEATPRASPPARRRQSSPPRPSPPRNPPAAPAARGGDVSAASAPAASSPLRVSTPSKGALPAPTPRAPEPSPAQGPARAPPPSLASEACVRCLRSPPPARSWTAQHSATAPRVAQAHDGVRGLHQGAALGQQPALGQQAEERRRAVTGGARPARRGRRGRSGSRRGRGAADAPQPQLARAASGRPAARWPAVAAAY